jgi:hypothetical protein
MGMGIVGCRPLHLGCLVLRFLQPQKYNSFTCQQQSQQLKQKAKQESQLSVLHVIGSIRVDSGCNRICATIE